MVTSDMLLHLFLSRQNLAIPPKENWSLHLYLSRKNLPIPLNIGVNDFVFIGTSVEVEINQLSIVHVLMLENGIVTSDILLHISLSRHNFAVPHTTPTHISLKFGVLNSNTCYLTRIWLSPSILVSTILPFFVDTSVQEETNNL